MVRRALDVTVDGEPLFGCVQSTWNLLERSAGPALAEAAAAGRGVIVKEAVANGRLTAGAAGGLPALVSAADELSVSPDAVAIAAALARPWASVALSGAVTVGQLRSNLAAAALAGVPDLDELVEPPSTYCATRARLPWR